MNTLFNYLIFKLIPLVIIAQLVYLSGQLDATSSMLNWQIKKPLPSSMNKDVSSIPKMALYPLTGTKANIESMYPLRDQEPVNAAVPVNEFVFEANQTLNGAPLYKVTSNTIKGGK